MTNYKEIPQASGKSYIIKPKEKAISLSEEQNSDDIVGVVFSKGKEATAFEEGQEVLINTSKSLKIEYFPNEIYWKTGESFIICGIKRVENESI